MIFDLWTKIDEQSNKPVSDDSPISQSLRSKNAKKCRFLSYGLAWYTLKADALLSSKHSKLKKQKRDWQTEKYSG